MRQGVLETHVSQRGRPKCLTTFIVFTLYASCNFFLKMLKKGK